MLWQSVEQRQAKVVPLLLCQPAITRLTPDHHDKVSLMPKLLISEKLWKAKIGALCFLGGRVPAAFLTRYGMSAGDGGLSSAIHQNNPNLTPTIIKRLHGPVSKTVHQESTSKQVYFPVHQTPMCCQSERKAKAKNEIQM